MVADNCTSSSAYEAAHKAGASVSFPPLSVQALLDETVGAPMVPPSAAQAVLALVEPLSVRNELALRLPRVPDLDALVESLLKRASDLAQALQVIGFRWWFAFFCAFFATEHKLDFLAG